MKLQIKRVDTSLPLPGYQTAGSVAFDLYSRTDIEIEPKTLALIPTNLIIKVPAGFMLAIVPRSSTPKKKGLLSPHGFGIIDQDYHGEKDELKLLVYNFSKQTTGVSKGERVGQACLIPIEKVEFEEMRIVKKSSRGGFGSTGN